MPAATPTQAIKTKREERLLEALKTHIRKERQRKKEEHEAEIEEERQRREREARERQDAMTLGETREQILKLDQTLNELKNQKQQLFLQLKKVLNEDENRKKQQQQKDSEILSMHNLPPQNTAPHGQIFLPPRQSHPQILQKGASSVSIPLKRIRNSSPPPGSGYFKNAAYSPPKHDDSRRNADVARVLWNKPQQYQTPPGTLFYQTTTTSSSQPDSRTSAAVPTQSIMYPSYNPNINMPPPIRQNYHIEIPQPPPPPPSQNHQAHSQKQDQQQNSAQVYHIDLDMPLMPPQGGPPGPNPNPPSMPPQHKNQVSMEKVSDRSGYVTIKLNPSQQIAHSSLSGIPPMHSNVMQIPTNQSPNTKPGGGISQGYSSRGSSHNHPPPPMTGQPPQPPPQSQIHYPRRLF